LEQYSGTPLLEAPELLKEAYDHKIDVWGIANIFYNLTVGKMLFSCPIEKYEDKLDEGNWTLPMKADLSIQGIKFLH
jgi:serine/threonine protein kinase